MEFDIIHIDKDYVRGKKIMWIKVFRQLTGADLYASKYTFDLLYERGYDLNEVDSLMQAVAWYWSWMAVVDNNPILYQRCLDQALALVNEGIGMASVVASMADGYLLD